MRYIKRSSVENEYISSLCTTTATILHNLQSHIKDTEQTTSDEESDSTDESDTANNESSESSHYLARLIGAVRRCISCLVDLGMVLRNSAESSKPSEELNVAQNHRAANDWHGELITRKYPHADALLLRGFGQVSWTRFVRLQQEREVNADKRTELSLVNATKSLASASDFKDSGLGTSLPYAQSTVSFMTSMTSDERLKVPKLPVEGKRGQSFDCTACGRLVKSRNDREWR